MDSFEVLQSVHTFACAREYLCAWHVCMLCVCSLLCVLSAQVHLVCIRERESERERS